MNNTDNELMVLIKTKDLIDYSLTMTDNTKRYPKKVRFTFVNRIQDLVLNIYKNISKTNELPINKRKSMQIDILSDINVLLFLIELSLLIQSMDKLYNDIFEGDGRDGTAY